MLSIKSNRKYIQNRHQEDFGKMTEAFCNEIHQKKISFDWSRGSIVESHNGRGNAVLLIPFKENGGSSGYLQIFKEKTRRSKDRYSLVYFLS